MKSQGVLDASTGPISHADPPAAIFLRFLKFGALAWGGPAAQIAMIKQECVDEEGWVDEDTFKKTLAVYQVLPGPEAHELCVYFGALGEASSALCWLGLGSCSQASCSCLGCRSCTWRQTSLGGIPGSAIADVFGVSRQRVREVLKRQR